MMDRIHEIILEQQQHVTALQALTDELRAMFPIGPAPQTATVVTTTAELLAALETGGSIEVAGSGEFFHPTGFVVPSNTRLTAPQGATLRADNQPAIRVKPGSTQITLDGMTCRCDFSGAVIQLGNNDTSQTSESQVPTFITVKNVTVPEHRGKRALEINAGDVLVKDCTFENVWTTSGQDSQAIGILNSPGRIEIDGGSYSAGSENIMLGGDSMKVVGQVISDVVIKNLRLYKPLEWKSDGVNRAVKNLFEIKAGRNVSLVNCTLDGSWKAAQDGWAIVITPKNSQFVENVTVDGCTVTNTAGGVQIMGEDYNSVTPQPTTGVVVRNTSFLVSKTTHGGRGILSLIVGGMKSLTFENVSFKGDGNCILQADSEKVQGPCLVQGGTLGYLQYGVMMPGSNYGDPIPPDSPRYNHRLIVTFKDSTFSGAAHSRFKANFPENIYA